MRVDYNRRRNRLVLDFPNTRGNRSLIKRMVGWRFVPGTKEWEVLLLPENVKALCELEATFTDSATRMILSKAEAHRAEMERIKTLVIPELFGPLFPFQRDGVRYLEAKKGNAVIGDEMGLGKTVQALSWIEMHPESTPVLVLCPASLKLNWKKEAKRWTSHKRIEVLSGRKPKTTGWKKADILIINYDVLSYWEKLLTGYITTMVIDECHYIKNRGAKRTQAALKIGKKAKNLIALSGTPIVNRPAEFFTTLNMIRPDIFDSWFHYANYYCDAHYDGFSFNSGGSSNEPELYEKLKRYVMIRRLKSEVMKELPEKMRNVVPMRLDNEKEYILASEDFESWLLSQGETPSAAQALQFVEQMRQLSLAGKMANCIEWVEDFLESDQKLVCFAWHTRTIDALQEHFGDICVRVDGKVGMDARQDAVDRFQSDPTARLFLGNIKAAGVGLTLTAASNVCFLELPWTPGDLVQAEDRCHRIGQEADSVSVWFLIAEGTIESRMQHLLEAKAKTVGAVLDGKEVRLGILRNLIDSYMPTK